MERRRAWNKEPMSVLAVAMSCVLLSTLVQCQNPEPIDKYANTLTLEDDPAPAYLYWNHGKTDITFEVHYSNVSRWFMFGLYSPDLGYSDTVVGWLNADGTGHFSNRKLSASQSVLTLDEEQKWIVLDTYAANNFYVFKFTRHIKLCDTTGNYLDVLEGAKNTLVFSTGEQADDIEGTVDFNKVYFRTDNATLLNQTAGPFECVTVSVKKFDSTPTSTYTSYIDLMKNGNMRLYWNTTSSGMFIGELHCRTLGWCSFGLSPNGGMDGSDVMVAWVNSNGRANFTDRYIVGRQVLVDTISQDWLLLHATEANGYTIIQFSRPIVLCSDEDRTIEVY